MPAVVSARIDQDVTRTVVTRRRVTQVVVRVAVNASTATTDHELDCVAETVSDSDHVVVCAETRVIKLSHAAALVAAAAFRVDQLVTRWVLVVVRAAQPVARAVTTAARVVQAVVRVTDTPPIASVFQVDCRDPVIRTVVVQDVEAAAETLEVSGVYPSTYPGYRSGGPSAAQVVDAVRCASTSAAQLVERSEGATGRRTAQLVVMLITVRVKTAHKVSAERSSMRSRVAQLVERAAATVMLTTQVVERAAVKAAVVAQLVDRVVATSAVAAQPVDRATAAATFTVQLVAAGFDTNDRAAQVLDAVRATDARAAHVLDAVRVTGAVLAPDTAARRTRRRSVPPTAHVVVRVAATVVSPAGTVIAQVMRSVERPPPVLVGAGLVLEAVEPSTNARPPR